MRPQYADKHLYRKFKFHYFSGNFALFEFRGLAIVEYLYNFNLIKIRRSKSATASLRSGSGFGTLILIRLIQLWQFVKSNSSDTTEKNSRNFIIITYRWRGVCELSFFPFINFLCIKKGSRSKQLFFLTENKFWPLWN